jgi:hypothetical protein
MPWQAIRADKKIHTGGMGPGQAPYRLFCFASMAKGYSTLPKVHLLGKHAQKDSGMTNRICESIVIDGRYLKKTHPLPARIFS